MIGKIAQNWGFIKYKNWPKIAKNSLIWSKFGAFIVIKTRFKVRGQSPGTNMPNHKVLQIWSVIPLNRSEFYVDSESGQKNATRILDFK